MAKLFSPHQITAQAQEFWGSSAVYRRGEHFQLFLSTTQPQSMQVLNTCFCRCITLGMGSCTGVLLWDSKFLCTSQLPVGYYQYSPTAKHWWCYAVHRKQHNSHCKVRALDISTCSCNSDSIHEKHVKNK